MFLFDGYFFLFAAVQMYPLPAKTFNALVVEIECMELVIFADHFFMNIENATRMFLKEQLLRDDDNNYWPTGNHYTQINVFEHSSLQISWKSGNYEDIIYEDDEYADEESDEECEEKENIAKENFLQLCNIYSAFFE